MQSSSTSPLGAQAEITQLLRRWQKGEDAAREQLVELVYDQVRAIARGAIRQHPGGTLSPTDLAHEALIRLLGEQADWEDRRHFYNVIAQATRQILVDSARRRQREKRGGGVVPEALSAAENVAISEDENILRLNEAIEQLMRRDARSAQVIELTYFGGLERSEVADALGLSVPTIDRDLRFGRAWLKRALEA
jgi:RNA polymerase sigma-70 factor, ECF subfamily